MGGPVVELFDVTVRNVAEWHQIEIAVMCLCPTKYLDHSFFKKK